MNGFVCGGSVSVYKKCVYNHLWNACKQCEQSINSIDKVTAVLFDLGK